MKVAVVTLAGSLALSTATAAVAPVLTVPEVIARHEALDGQTVRVRGWMTQACLRLGCSISATRDKDSVALSLGSSVSFDRSLQQANARGREIVVEGRVNRTCFQHSKGDPSYSADEIVICTDRADQLADPKLIKVLSSRDK